MRGRTGERDERARQIEASLRALEQQNEQHRAAIQAVRALEEKGLRSAVMEAVIAAGEMSAAMSKEGAK